MQVHASSAHARITTHWHASPPTCKSVENNVDNHVDEKVDEKVHEKVDEKYDENHKEF
jgi:hypothetical protein